VSGVRLQGSYYLTRPVHPLVQPAEGGVENVGVSRALTEMMLGSGVLVPTVDDSGAPALGLSGWRDSSRMALDAVGVLQGSSPRRHCCGRVIQRF